jgi:hypothetical protein
MKMKKKPCSEPLEPQQYEDRVEKVLHALAAAVSASQNLTTYMGEQLGPQRADLDHLLKDADQDLTRARRWIRGALRSRARTQRGRMSP